ncbi:hypothetical protein Agabi119p4_1663 [Agaricus bisporus var. burnettii]|uniref:NADP-dependent oxidoreductase domain-containing protein n=1 Tax=Agaricus bisporus var. burnettii TaxID=192524 RepID=A0A8H7F7Q2_AGABI|nr:hypothetical protein Agabi119p4_1663 [Agaricus bisporus var. burnettii]
MALAIDSTVRFFSGNHIYRLGFGVYKIANENTKAAVLEALRTGYRHIDAAALYENEGGISEAIQASGIPRSEIFLTTKIATAGHSYDSAIREIDDSLQRLQVDYVDLYLIHEPLGGAATRMAIWKALITAKKAGKIKDIGVSNYNIKHLEEIQDSGLELPVLNQIELHPLDQQRPIVKWCDEHDIKVSAHCPLIRGRFNIPVLQELAQKYKKDPAQVLIRWSLQKGYIPLPKSSRAERIRSNANVYDFNLSDAEMESLDKLDKGTDGAISWNPINAN